MFMLRRPFQPEITHMRSIRPFAALASLAAAIAILPMATLSQTLAAAQVEPKASPEVQSLLDAARSALEAKPPRTGEAMPLAEKAFALARTNGDRRGEVDAVRAEGSVQAVLGKPEAAQALYVESQRLAKGYGDRYGQSMALLKTGELLESRSRESEARDLYLRAVDLLGNTAVPPGPWLRTRIVGLDTGAFLRAVQKRNIADATGAYATAVSSMDRFTPNDRTRQVECWALRTRILELQGRHHEADAAYRGIEAACDDKEKLRAAALNLFGSAIELNIAGYKGRAARVYESVVRLFERAHDVGSLDAALNNLANAYIDIGEAAKGFAVHRKVYAARRARGDRSGIENSLENLGFACSRMGRFEEACEYNLQALAISRNISNTWMEAHTLMNLGSCELELQRIAEARDHLKAAVSLAKERDTATQAYALALLADVNVRSGDPLGALAELFEALQLHHARGARLDEAVVMRSIGSIYRDIGRLRSAESWYLSSLRICIETHSRPEEAKVRAHIGLLYTSMGLNAKAVAQHKLALKLARSIGDRRTEAGEVNNLGLCYEATGRLSLALDLFNKARDLSRRNADKNFEAIQTHNAGTVFEQQGQNARALDYYRRALTLAAAAQNATESANALTDVALVERLLGRPAESARHFQEAAQMAERLTSNVDPSAEARMSLQARFQPAYSGCVESLIAVHNTPEAFAWAQKMKGRALLELMANGGRRAGTLTPAEQRELGRQRANEERLNLRMVAEGVINKPGSMKRYARLKTELRDAEDRFQAYQMGLSASHPSPAGTWNPISTATIADIARFLPEDTAILDYVTLRGAEAVERVKLNHTVLFVVSRKGGSVLVNAYPIRVSNAELGRLCAVFHDACSDPRKPYGQLARRLYDLLVRPAAAHISGMSTVVVCPDGPLWNVPFQALNDGQRLLSERYALACSFSATGIQAERLMAATRRRPDRDTVIAFANPAFGNTPRFGDEPSMPGQRPIDSASRPIDSASRPLDSASRPLDTASRSAVPLYATILPRGAAIRPLPGTQREADTIARLFPDAKVYTGADAQEQTAKAEIGAYRYLHFATHGFVNDGAPLLSSLVLATPADDKEDGFLTAREISELRLSADLAVLSACNTARGDIKEGEGVLGLAWALTVAGCPTQVVSQWAVDDQSTAMLMGRFYENLKVRTMGKAAALQEAESWLRKQNPKYQHPYYWAPFVLNGAWK
jgi:CHAT domain-containing protein/tetratricopeptide (TPR) repeat protein